MIIDPNVRSQLPPGDSLHINHSLANIVTSSPDFQQIPDKIGCSHVESIAMRSPLSVIVWSIGSSFVRGFLETTH